MSNMSSALSSLKKGKRTPLNASCKAHSDWKTESQVPFRDLPIQSSNGGDDLSSMFHEIADHSVTSNVISRLPKATMKHKESSQVPTDGDLVSVMAARLVQAEQQVKSSTRQIIEKDRRIKVLEEKVMLLEKARGYNSDSVNELEKKCRSLQSQVHQMEAFLADYGMIWVGEEEEPFEPQYESLTEDCGKETEERSALSSTFQGNNSVATDGLWKPDSSVAADEWNVNFDLIVKNIQELNVLAGEGCAVVAHTAGGATLKVPDPIPLTLFANGIVMFAGPFRPYSDPTTQRCINDITEGYFPSELQSRYPDGVPFKVTDRRDTVYQDQTTELLFPGSGQTIQGRYIPSPCDGRKVTSVIPGQKAQSVDAFLSRLPQSVVKDGKIVDVRSGIAESIKGQPAGPSDVAVLETPALREIRSRAEKVMANGERVTSASAQITTLRIKSETGDKIYLLKMKFTDTIADVRKYLDSVRDKGAPQYEIKSSFPSKVYDDPRANLKECGLVPNATLHLLVRKM